MEYNAAGDMTRRYVHNVGADVPMLQFEPTLPATTLPPGTLGTPYWLHGDERGSIVAISPSSGAPAINSYDEYGIPALGNTGRFQYTGQIWIPELGMYHYKARVYSPTHGRFLQTDPVGYEDQYNLYAYVGNDPVNGTDPTGMAICGSCSGYTTDYKGGGPARTARGGPLNGRRVDPSTELTPDTVPNAQSVYAYHGGYYENGPNGLVWHSLGEDAAWAAGIFSVTILGGEVLGPAIIGAYKGVRALGTLRLVIGRGDDLVNLGRGERSLMGMPNRGSPRANWKQNSGLLRQEMRRGQPIRDASPGQSSPFLNAERNQLRNGEWTFNPEDSLWTPPMP